MSKKTAIVRVDDDLHARVKALTGAPDDAKTGPRQASFFELSTGFQPGGLLSLSSYSGDGDGGG